MEQKEAELEKEITVPEEEAPAESLVVPERELPEETDDEAEAEAEQALMPLASGVGSRLKRRKAAFTAPAKPETVTGDVAEEADPEAEETDAGDGADYPLAAWHTPTPESKGLGRGGLAAVVLLVIFVPVFIYFLFQLYSNTERLDAMRKNLADFNGNATAANEGSGTVSAETGLVQLLNRPNAKMYPLKVENLSPSSQMVFYTDGNALAFTYGNLDPLNTGQMYSIWVSNKPAGSTDAAFIRLANLPDNHTTGSALVVNRAVFPSGFNLANYAEIFVTVEQVDQKNDKPSGPRTFSLDLSQLKK